MTETFFSLFDFTIVISAEFKQILLAGLIGLMIGLERELRGKPASLRTFATISIGSCLFTIFSVQAGADSAGFYDSTRIAAQIVTGIGFLGGGVIFRTRDKVEGVTTGAMIWFAAALGMGCGFNRISEVMAALIIASLAHGISIILYNRLFDKLRVKNGGNDEISE